jgi:hypothetical protein
MKSGEHKMEKEEKSENKKGHPEKKKFKTRKLKGRVVLK